MFEYLIGGFVLGIFAGIAIVNTWNYYWDTHGERPFAAQEDDLFRLIKANAEVANLNADLQIEIIQLRNFVMRLEPHVILRYIEGPNYATGDMDELQYFRELAALAEGDLSKLATQQKPTEEAMEEA